MADETRRLRPRSGSFLAATGTTLLSAALGLGCGGASAASAPESMPSNEMPDADAPSDDGAPMDDIEPTEDASTHDDAEPVDDALSDDGEPHDDVEPSDDA